MCKQHFSKMTEERIGYYVYALVDPIKNKIFYIGKGQGNRAFDHANNNPKLISEIEKEKSDSKARLSAKAKTIQDIVGAGEKVKVYILRHSISSEKAAYEIESTLIDLLSYQDFQKQSFDSLTNIQSGHHQAENGIMDIGEIEELYATGTVDLSSLGDKKFLAIKINKTFVKGTSDTVVYENVRKYWRVSLRRAQTIDYVLAVYNGIIRGVFPCKKCWHKQSAEEDENLRCYFESPSTLTAEEQKDLDKVRNALENKYLPQLSKGQNPIQYFDKKRR